MTALLTMARKHDHMADGAPDWARVLDELLTVSRTSTEDFAKAMRISRQSASSWRYGKIKHLSFEQMKDLANLLGVPPALFLGTPREAAQWFYENNPELFYGSTPSPCNACLSAHFCAGHLTRHAATQMLIDGATPAETATVLGVSEDSVYGLVLFEHSGALLAA